MINIRPVSDLRNKYPEIEELVLKEDEAVYLTKNGYGTMVVMSIEKYSELVDETDEIDRMLEEAEYQAKTNPTRYTHEEVFSRIRSRINDK